MKNAPAAFEAAYEALLAPMPEGFEWNYLKIMDDEALTTNTLPICGCLIGLSVRLGIFRKEDAGSFNVMSARFRIDYEDFSWITTEANFTDGYSNSKYKNMGDVTPKDVADIMEKVAKENGWL